MDLGKTHQAQCEITDVHSFSPPANLAKGNDLEEDQMCMSEENQMCMSEEDRMCMSEKCKIEIVLHYDTTNIRLLFKFVI